MLDTLYFEYTIHEQNLFYTPHPPYLEIFYNNLLFGKKPDFDTIVNNINYQLNISNQGESVSYNLNFNILPASVSSKFSPDSSIENIGANQVENSNIEVTSYNKVNQ